MTAERTSLRRSWLWLSWLKRSWLKRSWLKRSWLKRSWLWRAVRHLRQADERPEVSSAARAADTAIAVVATFAAVVSVIMQARSGTVSMVVPVRPGGEVIEFGPQQFDTFPSPGIVLGAALTTAPLAFRRIYPIGAFLVILGAVMATSGHTTSITLAAAIFAAYCAVAYSTYRRLALLSVLAGSIVVTAAYPNTTPPVPERYTAMLILLPTAAVGLAIRVWRGRARDSAERLRRAEAEHEAQTRRAVEQERARIASEMHDVVTHNVSVMVVQAGAARRVLESSPGEARQALLAVEASGRTAMTELRYLLGLLAGTSTARADGTGVGPSAADAGGAGTAAGERGGAAGEAVRAGAGRWLAGGRDDEPDPALAPQPGVARIPALLARVRAAGVPVELVTDTAAGTERGLPPGIDLAAFRVVQEAMTNVMKHAGAAPAVVRLEYRPDEVLITVSDDGPPAGTPAVRPPGPDGGRGLIGLRERIAVYGGELDAGPRPGGGWRLTARIPVAPAPGLLAVPPGFLGAGTG